MRFSENRGGPRNYSPMAVVGLRPPVRTRIPQSVSSRERGAHWDRDWLGQDLRQRAEIASRRPGDFELHPEESSVGEQPATPGLPILGLARRRKRRPELLHVDLRVQDEAGQV